MKGKKLCFGLLLLSFIMVGSLSSVSSTYSLSHDYNGIPFLTPIIPLKYTTVDGRDSIDWNSTITSVTQLHRSDSYFTLGIYNNAWDESMSNISLAYNLSYMKLRYNSESSNCLYYTDYVSPLFYINKSDSSFTLRNSQSPFTYFYPSQFVGSNLSSDLGFDPSSYCNHRDAFGSLNQPQFSSNPLPAGSFNCGFSSGTTCQGMQDFRQFVRTEFLPDYWFSTDGFYVHSTAIDTDSGVHYNHSFSLKDLFNTEIKSFSSLTLPLFDYDGYFWDSSNLYEGRPLEWRGVFEFDGSFEWNPNVSDSSSRFQIFAEIPVSPYSLTIPCTTNLRTLPDLGVTQLEYSCSTVLEQDYPWLIPRLSILGPIIPDSGGSRDYVWKTDADWRFGHQLLITDNDETPGTSFNSDLHGNNIPGDVNSEPDNNLDWFSSLTLMFDFSTFNPFAGIFNLFTHSNNCVQIPILAGMLHAQESTYCSWFPSSVRAVLTPVFGLSSVMLIFGFFVRWLSGSSGNFFEDSGHLEPPGTSAQNGTVSKHGWRRVK